MAKFKRRNKSRKKRHPPVKNADIGTVLIHSLVVNSETREEDRLALNAIKDSVWTVFESKNTTGAKVHWAAAGILAAYNLGKDSLKLPTGEKETATP